LHSGGRRHNGDTGVKMPLSSCGIFVGNDILEVIS